jgi:hypothetical protein
MAKSAKGEVDLAVKELGQVVKGAAGMTVSPERIREISKNVNDFEVLDFRLCQQYGNGALTEQEYKILLQELIPGASSNRTQIPGYLVRRTV